MKKKQKKTDKLPFRYDPAIWLIFALATKAVPQEAKTESILHT